MMSVDPRVHGYSPERTTQFFAGLQERVSALPGVLSVAATDAIPLSGGHRSDGFSVVGQKPEQNVPVVELFMATPGYFGTLGIPRLLGREFAHEAASGQKVAVVNEAFAKQLFHGDNPIGRHVNGAGVDYEIVGVVGNIKARTIGEETRPVLFRSLAQSIGSEPSFLGYTLIVRYQGDSAAVANEVRAQIHTLDPAMAVYNVETMEEHLRSALFLPRLAGTLFGAFGMIGLLLATIGLYGVMSYSVTPPHARDGHPSRTWRAARRRAAAGGAPGHAADGHCGGPWPACGIAGGKILQQLSLWGSSARSGDVPDGAASVAWYCARGLLDSRTARGACRSAGGVALRVATPTPPWQPLLLFMVWTPAVKDAARHGFQVQERRFHRIRRHAFRR